MNSWKYGKIVQYGMEVWILVHNGVVVGTFMSEQGARSAYMRLK